MSCTLETLFTETLFGFDIIAEVIDFQYGCDLLSDMFDRCDRHEGGVTVQSPHPLYDGGTKFWIPLQTSVSELASHYSKQGMDNPSGAAYESLQTQLAHYIQASDCAIQITIKKAGITLAETTSCTFDLSPEWPWDISYWKDYGAEVTREALYEAWNTLEVLCNGKLPIKINVL